MEQIIKFGISNYLQLCVEAGFSQIQSHIIVTFILCASTYQFTQLYGFNFVLVALYLCKLQF